MVLCIHVKEPTRYQAVFGRQMKPVLRVFQVDQCKHSFGHNSLRLKRIITKFGQMNLLVKNFHMQVWFLREIVPIATDTEDYSYVILGPDEAKLGRFHLHSEKSFYKFGCYGGLPHSKRYLLRYVSKGITSKFRKLLPWNKNFPLKLKFYESLLPWQQRKYQLLFCFKR